MRSTTGPGINPALSLSTQKRRKSVKKKKTAAAMDLEESPLKRQLEETETWTRPEMDTFEAMLTAKERVQVRRESGDAKVTGHALPHMFSYRWCRKEQTSSCYIVDAFDFFTSI